MKPKKRVIDYSEFEKVAHELQKYRTGYYERENERIKWVLDRILFEERLEALLKENAELLEEVTGFRNQHQQIIMDERSSIFKEEKTKAIIEAKEWAKKEVERRCKVTMTTNKRLAKENKIWQEQLKEAEQENLKLKTTLHDTNTECEQLEGMLRESAKERGLLSGQLKVAQIKVTLYESSSWFSIMVTRLRNWWNVKTR